jgi:alpha-beta hydrolase superfamily lysophospholipase
LEKLNLTLRDNHMISLYKWEPDCPPLAIVHILHGMAEYALRYDEFARFLTSKGFLVYADDHRGHGQNYDELGYISDEDGFDCMVEDQREIIEHIKSENDNLKVFLFAHSMGSFIGERYMELYGNSIDGIILSGTNGAPPKFISAGILLSKVSMIFKGRHGRGDLIDKIAFDDYNKKYENPRTKFDWISSSQSIVDDYINDPLCGYICPVSFYHDLFRGIVNTYKPQNLKLIPLDLKISLLSGELDPVSNYGEGIRTFFNTLENLGVREFSMKLYPGCRHEIINEVNNSVVFSDIYDIYSSWI